MFCRRFVHVEGLGDEFGSFPKASARTWDRFTPSCVFNVSALADLATSACGHVNPHQSESSDTARPNLNAREVCAMFYYGFVWKKGVAAHACHTHCRLSGPCTTGQDIFLKFPPAHLSPGGPSEALWARFLGLALALVCSGSTSVPDVPWVARKLPVRPPHASRASPKAPGHPQDTPKDSQVAPNKQEQLPPKIVFYIFC